MAACYRLAAKPTAAPEPNPSRAERSAYHVKSHEMGKERVICFLELLPQSELSLIE